jgi:bacillolysin
MPTFSTSASRFVRVLGVAAALAGLFAAGSEYPRAQNREPSTVQDPLLSLRERTDCLASGDARTARQLRTGAIRFVGTQPGRSIPNPRPLEAARSPEAAARAYLSVCGGMFGLRDQASELGLTRATAVDARRSVVRFQQTHRGVPIVGAELIVHLDGARNVLAAAGEMLPEPAVNTTSRVDAAAALQTALAVVARSHTIDPATLTATAPELWVYAPTLIGPENGPARLVWRIQVTPRVLAPIRELVLIDAERGSVALHFNQIETARNRKTYSANNTGVLPGTLVCNESNPGCSGGDADAVAAHQYAGDTYNYYLTNHGRDSLDNAGMTLTSTVHFGEVGFRNAFWTGSQMAYGDGFSRADDVVGHELTHGVTTFSSNLFYYYQSGAINESLSDVFGEFIDQTNGHGTDAAGVRWIIGEDLPGGGAIRNMQDPTAFDDPDRMTSPLYFIFAQDNGGVHFNNGINNKAAYLMVDGGTFNGQTITGLGIPKVSKIYYEVQTHLLTSGADYGDFYEALYQGCTNLVGVAGITAADCQQVRNATIAVEMNLQPVSGFNPDAPLCASGQTPVMVFFDSMESGPGNFTFSAAAGASRWSDVTNYAHSGLHSLFAHDFPAVIFDTSVSMTDGVVVPSSAFLHFAHAYGFDAPDFDGGVVEYSANGGSTWIDAGSLFDANGYTGTVASASGNPLGNRSAFVGASHGYVSSRVNLSSLAGQTVRFRWRMGLDSEISDLGWFLDDVRIYTCAGPQIAAISPNTGSQGRSNLNVAVTGQYTHFVQGQTVASFGAGITVNSTIVADATHATANVTIAGNATLGARTVILTTGGEVAAATLGFTITPGPSITNVTPRTGHQGQANLTVTLTGQFSNFVQGQTMASFGAGITVNSMTVTDATHVIVNVTIAANAALGLRAVTLVTGAEVLTSANVFTVMAVPGTVPPMAFVVGRRLSPSQGGTNGIQTVTVINTASNNIVTTIPAGQGCFCTGPDGVAITPDNSTVYVTNELDNTVTVINTASNTVVRTIAVGSGPIGVAASPDGQRVYVLNGSGSPSVSVINTVTNKIVATIPLGVPQARGIAIGPDGTRLYVSTYGSNSIKVINTNTNSIVTTIVVGQLPLGVDVSPNGLSVYVANALGDTVSVIDATTNTVVATIGVGTSPHSARIAPDGSRAYVANSGSSRMSVIDTATKSVVATVPADAANALEFTPDGARVFAANFSNVQVINTSTNTVLTTIQFDPAIHARPSGIAITRDAAAADTDADGLPDSWETHYGLNSTSSIGPDGAGGDPDADGKTNHHEYMAGTHPGLAATLTPDRAVLRFGAVTTGASFAAQTSAQPVRLMQSGNGPLTWTATSSSPWLQVSPASGTGPATLSVRVIPGPGAMTPGIVTGSIRLSLTGPVNAFGTIAVTLNVKQSGTSLNPFGVVDTPLDNTTGVTGGMPITGWALDDVEVSDVFICRAPVGGETAPVDPNCGGAAQIFVGSGLFMDGTRPDVQAAFPAFPQSSRGGWGLMVLTNMLSGQGNGTYRFFAYARDREGRIALLGIKTVTCDNAHAGKPFGAIDTPGQGATVSGNPFINFAWALTQPGKVIPFDGSTMQVYVDGVAIGSPSYNHYRVDIATLFPGLANSNGAVGFKLIDTTALTNGLHTIVWVVTDSAGMTDGIGSRYFTVSNGVSAVSSTAGLLTASSAFTSARVSEHTAIESAPRTQALVLGRRGWDRDAPWRWYAVGSAGRAVLRGEEIDRFELALGEHDGERYTAYLRVGEELTALPVGSRLDETTGAFTWSPGLGFVGSYDLVFVRWAGERAVARQDVRIIIAAKSSGHVGAQVVIDAPRMQQEVGQPFHLGGWAADLDAGAGTGVDALHVWAYPQAGGPPIFLGVATYGGARPDVAAVHGDQFRESGYGLTVQSLPPGSYDLAVFAWSNVSGGFVPAKLVRVMVR